MLNVYQDIVDDMNYNKFMVGDLLFVEYTCPIAEDVLSVWTETDYIIHVLSGQKKFWTGTKEWMLTSGDSVYVKKGSYCLSQYFEQDYCMMGFFINDDFIRSIIKELHGKVPMNARVAFNDFKIKRITLNPILEGFFTSMYPFFKMEQCPSNSLLELKLKELIINILTTESNTVLSSYFQSFFETDRPSIRTVMEENFCHNLSMEEFATLAHRSLSSFKRDFKTCYGVSPGKWLLKRRLEFSLILLQNKALSISEVAYQAGFESSSHFSRSFKTKFGSSPTTNRDQNK